MADPELARLDQLIAHAKQLGFHDDVAHWKRERARHVAMTEREETC